MKKEWTKEQTEVIRHRGGNLLVSASAGSGKTAVLVERIMGRLFDEKEPVGIDELLVVTFTRDAAGEMKERIAEALSKRLEEVLSAAPSSESAARLIRQSALLGEANISTIDSFCRRVVMENFREADIDPGVRTIDDTEGIIIRKKVIDELLENEYEDKRTEFINFVEYFARGKSDAVLEELIMQLYRFSESLPDKNGWFDKILTDIDSPFKDSVMERMITEYAGSVLSEFLRGAREFLALTREAGGPVQYESAGISDVEFFESLISLDSYDGLFAKLSGISFETLSRKKPKDVEIDESKKNRAKDLRDSYKKGLESLREDFFYESMEDGEASKEISGRAVKELIGLVKKFDTAYREEKKRRNIADISDWAHMAIKVLLDESGQPSEAARTYREHFVEIMIDEYQDSNLLQERILTAIARTEDGKSNIFMVGDVKQSIYKFRQARPELFIEKYNKYDGGNSGRRIDLHKNFRSGTEVIDSVNAVFERIMTKAVGDIEYDEAARLVKGRDDTAEDRDLSTEVLIYDKDSEVPEELQALSDVELEAYTVAHRIKELKKEGYGYKDVAILLRTNTGWSESFRRILTAEGIPAICESNSGYFSAWEVQVMLALLTILDNPRQDIPLATVLLSPVGGFDEKDLAEFRSDVREAENNNDLSLWEMLLISGDERCGRFVDWISQKRKEMIYTPVHEFINKLLEETNFYNYAAAMHAGETRAANLEMLVIKAKAYEATSLYGVVHFIRYIEKLRKYDADFGEAGAAEGADAVRIMSIHKSKGLQFPAVFISGMAKSMNNQDSRASMVIHTDYGIGVDCFNIETREKKTTAVKKMIARKLRLDSLAEEIRLLYVAMTRAEQKLILTAGISSVSEKLGNYYNDKQNYISLIKANSLLDFALPALLEEEKRGKLKLCIRTAEDLIKGVTEDMAKKEVVENDIKKLIVNLPELEEYEAAHRIIKNELSYSYPFMGATLLKTKQSVTELKRLRLSEEEAGEASYQESSVICDKEEYIPEFIEEKSTEISGSARGTLYHRILSRLPFEIGYGEAEFKEYLAKRRIDKKLTEAEYKSIDVEQFTEFFKSGLYERMCRANDRGKLYREVPFVMGEDVEMSEGRETVLIQGIIDAWFVEDERVVLIDYKTDRVFGKEAAKELADRYGGQLDSYAEALRRVTKREVDEKLIYSFGIGREIRI